MRQPRHGMTAEQKTRKASYDKVRKTLTAEMKRQRKIERKIERKAEKDAIAVKLQAAFTKEENIERTRLWWGKP